MPKPLEGKRALVTGVTGTVGDRIAKHIANAGGRVRALIRSARDEARCVAMGCEPVIGDLLSPDSLAPAVADVDLVVHCAAHRHDPELARLTNVDGTVNLARASHATGVSRFVHISTLSVYGEPIAGRYDESTPLVGDDAPSPYHATKARGEEALRDVAADGLDTVVLRVGAVGGVENSHWGDRLVRLLAEREEVDMIHPGDLVAWIHADNFADMVLLAAMSPEAEGEAFNAIDGNFPRFEGMARIAWALGKPIRIPDRPAVCPIFETEKIEALGYRPRRTFEENVNQLEVLAKTMRAQRESAPSSAA